MLPVDSTNGVSLDTERNFSDYASSIRFTGTLWQSCLLCYQLNRRYTLHSGCMSRLTTFHDFCLTRGVGWRTADKGCAYHLSSWIYDWVDSNHRRVRVATRLYHLIYNCLSSHAVDVNVHPVYWRMVGHWLIAFIYSCSSANRYQYASCQSRVSVNQSGCCRRSYRPGYWRTSLRHDYPW